MLSRKSQSVEYREKGNTFYVSAFEETIPICLQQARLKDALKWYEKAKQFASKQDETCSVAKNIGVASKKLACMMSQRNESIPQRHYYFKEAILNFDVAYRFSSCKAVDWLDNVTASFQEAIQEAIYDVNLLDFEQKMTALYDYVSCISNATNQRGELLIEIAQMRFHHALTCIIKHDHKSCLRQIAECYWPIEEAKRVVVHDTSYIAVEVRVLEKDLVIHRCIAESTQARLKGDEILESLLKDEENLNMEMVWSVVDLYKEAIILTRETDMEVEAIALSRLGNINDKILKDKIKAKECFRRAIQLAMSLHPRTFDSEDWFKLCHDVLERYQREVIQQESDIWNKERATYVEELKEELIKLKEVDKEGPAKLLKHVYEKYPPKNKSWVLGEIPEKGCENFHSDMKPLFRTAVIHYHPDRVKVERDDEVSLCIQIMHKDTSSEMKIYRNGVIYPPKNKSWILGEIPERGSENFHSEMKLLFRTAVKVERDGKKCEVLCEEISKVLAQHYVFFKG